MFLLLLVLPGLLADENLFTNPGFENTDGWICNSCKGSLVSDSHGGSHSYKVEQRKYNWGGISQEVFIQPGHNYYFKAYVKLLNTADGKQYHDIEGMLDIIDTAGNHKYDTFGKTGFVTAGDWFAVGGDYYVPHNTESIRYYLQIPEVGVNYLIDDAELTHIPYISNFISQTDDQIDHIRKANLSITLGGSNPSALEIDVQQTRSDFGWGSAVNVDYIHDSKHRNYQNFFYDIFEWGVLENALKWPNLEQTKGIFKPGNALAAIDAMRARGIKLRGQNMFWGGETHVPSWQKTLTPADLKLELEKHIIDMVTTFRGKLEQWDVNNENIHLHYYEDQLKDPKITQWLFEYAHRYDNNTELYLNDYSIVSGQYSTVAYQDQAMKFLAANIHVDGIGVQSHLGDAIDISVIKRRLDEIAKVGLPIWITELDINESNDLRKAEKYEEVMRLYFSHPAVKGVMFWGFWDGRHWRPAAALANGHDVTPNAAGKKVKELLKQTWRTEVHHSLAHGHTVNMRGFLGSYELKIRHDGKTIHTETFDLGKNGNHLRINLVGSGNSTNIGHVIIG
ncbi:hypothetical protein SNE40_000502 [Patella caerulea]|uniref:GH10 domain-containing protein n=1 Tax=Patella caerulea TaxID=87958 RepID=A0AAN8QA26_PATCE